MESTRRILWAVLLLTLPVPYWVMEGGWVPTFWIFQLAGFSLAVFATEGGSIVGLITGLFVAEALLATGILYVVARLAAGALHRAVPPSWSTTSIVATVISLLGISMLHVYATPLIAGGARVNLLQLFA